MFPAFSHLPSPPVSSSSYPLHPSEPYFAGTIGYGGHPFSIPSTNHPYQPSTYPLPSPSTYPHPFYLNPSPQFPNGFVAPDAFSSHFSPSYSDSVAPSPFPFPLPRTTPTPAIPQSSFYATAEEHVQLPRPPTSAPSPPVIVPSRKRGIYEENVELGPSEKPKKKRKVSKGSGNRNGNEMRQKLRGKLTEITLSGATTSSTASTSDSDPPLIKTLLEKIAAVSSFESPSLDSHSPSTINILRTLVNAIADQSPNLVSSFQQFLVDVSKSEITKDPGIASTDPLMKLDDLDRILRETVMSSLEGMYPNERDEWFQTIREKVNPQARLLTLPILHASFYPPLDWNIQKKSRTGAPNWTEEHINLAQNTLGKPAIFDQIPMHTPIDFENTSPHPDTIKATFLRPASNPDDSRGQQFVHTLTREYVKVLLEARLLSIGITLVAGAQPTKAIEKVLTSLKGKRGVGICRLSCSIDVEGIANVHGSYPRGTAPMRFILISLGNDVVHVVFESAHYCFGKVAANNGSGRRAYYSMAALDAIMDLMYLVKNNEENDIARSSTFASTAAPQARSNAQHTRNLAKSYAGGGLFKQRNALRRTEIENGFYYRLDEIDPIVILHHVRQRDISDTLPPDTSEYGGQSLLGHLCSCSSLRGAIKRAENDRTLSSLGLPTSNERAADTRIKNDRILSSLGLPTSSQEAANKRAENDRVRSSLGLPTSFQEATSKRAENDRTLSSLGLPTSYQEAAVKRAETNRTLSSIGLPTSYEQAAVTRAEYERTLSSLGLPSSYQQGGAKRTRNNRIRSSLGLPTS
ncbi:uncharacterized protein JCM6883_004780 [Sporobolomyces salmoneus]|uniref:uncharacterized protein n=1 Tax=Sporobolomyces salmoneus TaxID=183962 RepID=UPI003171D3DD